MNYFKEIDLFASLSVLEQENLSDFCQIQNLNSGENLFYEGDETQAIYIIVSGSLKVQRKTNDTIQTLAVLQAGDIVGEMTFFGKNIKRNADVKAIESTQLIVMLHFGLDQLLLKYPNIHATLSSILEERIAKNQTL